MVTGERTRPGSSQSMSAIRVRADELLPETLTPLVAEPMHVRGARRWIDDGMPDNTCDEYPTWVLT